MRIECRQSFFYPVILAQGRRLDDGINVLSGDSAPDGARLSREGIPYAMHGELQQCLRYHLPVAPSLEYCKASLDGSLRAAVHL